MWINTLCKCIKFIKCTQPCIYNEMEAEEKLSRGPTETKDRGEKEKGSGWADTFNIYASVTMSFCVTMSLCKTVPCLMNVHNEKKILKK